MKKTFSLSRAITLILMLSLVLMCFTACSSTGPKVKQDDLLYRLPLVDRNGSISVTNNSKIDVEYFILVKEDSETGELLVFNIDEVIKAGETGEAPFSYKMEGRRTKDVSKKYGYTDPKDGESYHVEYDCKTEVYTTRK